MIHQFSVQNESNNIRQLSCTCAESLLNSSFHFSVPCNSQIICFAICATNLLTFAMDVDETHSALEEAGAETYLDTDKEGELLRFI